MKLEGKVAAVTGSAMGLGREIAMTFAGEGAALVLVDVNYELGGEVENLIASSGGRARFVGTDVSKSTDIQRMVSEAVSTFGRLDIMVNNAGISEAAPVSNLTEEAWDRVINVNLKGTWLGSKYAAIQMLSQGNGVIVNMSSELGLVGYPTYSAYCASKGGVIALTRALAAELAPKIRVNCICPGAVLTPMLERELRTSLSTDQGVEAAKNELVKRYPLGRLGSPEDVAKAALYLACDDSAWVTGVALPVDGGGIAV